MDNERLQLCIRRLRDGDDTAFEEIYEDLKTPVFTIVCRIVRDREQAEDILHDLFLKLYQAPPAPSVKNPRAWIFQAAHNLALNSLRRPIPASLSEDEPDPGNPVADVVALRLDMEKALKQLPLTETAILSYHIYGEMKFREIAELMGLPLGTVLWRYRRAIRRLQAYFKGGRS